MRQDPAPTVVPTSAADYGSVVWHELETPDLGASAKFYGELFGWQLRTEKDGKMSWTSLSGTIGGARLVGPDERQTSAHWMGTVAVPDAQAAVRRARELGGTVHRDPAEVDGRTIAVVADPDGAAAVTLSSGTPWPRSDRLAPGAFSLDVLLTSDARRESNLFGPVLGWTSLEEKRLDSSVFIVCSRDGVFRAGVYENPTVGTTSWLFYIKVPDLDAALQRARAQHAVVLFAPISVAHQRLVGLRDPQGASFAMQEGEPVSP